LLGEGDNELIGGHSALLDVLPILLDGKMTEEETRDAVPSASLNVVREFLDLLLVVDEFVGGGEEEVRE
jgi:hypothetical protein